ncbi:uncharacterized protein J3D65DRAFT_458520 [Phyllosticta citribraziliensis]|uniref:Uncharacterized protein n=1 Tax=Phyllosticta citribraziliensis TaxID=989973 RepID=A0ABR1LF38_9PEZI
MSTSDTSPPPTSATAKPDSQSQPSLSAEDADELRKLDDAFDRIRNNIPDAPYIVTVPCAEPRYHHWSAEQAASWCRNTPFDPGEERLQYMSFILRDPSDSCFVCRTEVDEERDRRAAMKDKITPSSASTPVRNNVPKKKISLAAYKSQRASGLLGKPSGGEEKTKREDSRLREVHSLPEKPPPTEGTSEKGQKRPRDDVDAKQSSSPSRAESPPAVKKHRASDSSIDKPSTEPINNSESTPHGLPRLLSPILSPQPQGLPPLLSPTLPDEIEAELSKRAVEERRNNRQKENGTNPSQDHKSGRPPQVSPVRGKNGHPAGDAQPSAKSSKNHLANDAAKSTHPEEKRRQLVVALRYGRKRRQDVERYLRLPPNRKNRPKEHDESEYEKPRKTEHVKPKETLPKEMTRKTLEQVAEKRPRGTDDGHLEARPPKRPRAPSNLDLDKKPRTPIAHSQQSPSFSQKSSTQKNQYLTPRKELKAAGMIRSVSNESNGIVVTPGQAASTPSDIKGSIMSVNGKANEAQVWGTHSKKLNELGRRIKHETQALSQPVGKQAPPLKDRKRAAVMSIECILTYMAAYFCQDYRVHLLNHPNTNENWRTMLPLFRYFKSGCQSFPVLEGLRLQLGAIISHRVATVVAQQSVSQTGHEGEKDKDSQGSSFGAPGSTIQMSADKALAVMSENVKFLGTMLGESRGKLSIDDLIDHFPRTWDGRTRQGDSDSGATVPDMSKWEQLSPGNLEGPYFLPLGVETTPVQAVRMGLVFLDEWMKREGVDYKLQLKLHM